MTLQPLRKHIIVQRRDPQRVTESGIVIQGSVNGQDVRAEIIAIGQGCDLNCDIGDIVLPDWSKCRPIRFEDQDYLLVDQDHVHGVFVNAKDSD